MLAAISWSRAIRFAVGGWVEKSCEMPVPRRGLIM